MGRARRSRRRGWSRREFLRGAGGLAAGWGLAAAPATGRGDDTIGPFLHGVASGDPLSDRVVLWTRISGSTADSVSVDYLVARDPELSQWVSSGSGSATSAADYTFKIDVTGLEPGTTYYYRFSCGGVSSAIGRTRTLPVGAVDHLRIAVCSCASWAHGYFNAYRRIAERSDLDVVLHLGDYIYEVSSGQYGSLRDYQPPWETVTLSDYRTRLAQYHTDPDLQEMHRQQAVIAIWDDHDFADDAWQGGARNHQPATEGSWNDRVAAALQAYYEWTPTRLSDPDEPRRHYRRFRFGDLVDLFMLEDRLLARDQQISAADTFTGTPGEQIVFEQKGAFANPKRQMLGAEQEGWLFGGLRGSSAAWKLIGQGTMMAQLKLQGATNASGKSKYLNHDQWDGYNAARNRMFRCFAGEPQEGIAPVRNAVVLSGDIHSGWAADLTPDPNNPDVSSGGYNPATGGGALAVEFTCTSITAPAWVEVAQLAGAAEFMNPAFKYAELEYRGYSLLDIRRERVSCEWWYIDTITEPSSVERLGAAFQVRDGTAHLTQSHASPPKPLPPAPAP